MICRKVEKALALNQMCGIRHELMHNLGLMKIHYNAALRKMVTAYSSKMDSIAPATKENGASCGGVGDAELAEEQLFSAW